MVTAAAPRNINMPPDNTIPGLEILSVQVGLRRAALVEPPRALLHYFTEYLSRNSIPFKCVPQDQMHLKRLALGLRPSGDRNPNAVMLYAAADPADVEKLYQLDIRDNSVEMGLLLGYPPCCVNYHQLMKTDPAAYPSWKSHFKYAPHNPCSISCAPTAAMDENLKNLNEKYFSSAGAATSNTA